MIDGPPSNLGLDIIDVTHGSGYTDLVIDISITHPFASATKFTGFDVCGVVMGVGGVAHPFDPSLVYGGTSAQQLLNADGFTRWMNRPEFDGTDPAILGYQAGKLGTKDYLPTSTLNPYKYFCDGLGADDNVYQYLINNPDSRGVFTAGSTNTRRYQLRFPDAVGVQFQYAILARWANNVNAPDPPVNIPDDFPLEANAREAIALSVTSDSSDMWCDGSSGGGNFRAEISVVNWVAELGSGDVMSDYAIHLYSNAWAGAIHPDMTAVDNGNHWCTFAIDEPVTPIAAGPLDVWISVSQPGITYANPFGVPTGADSATLAAHFRYRAFVDPAGTEWEPPTDHPPRFLFIHHSTGDGFLFEGGMWELLEDAGFEVHDRTYGDGWVGDNTNPPDWPITFTTYYDDMITWEMPPDEHYDIVAFKSCFPASYIESEEMLNDYKSYYNTVKSVTQAHPETLFIPFSTPPLVPGDTEPTIAARARQFANWLTGPYDDGEYNLVAYDVFNILAGNDPLSGDFNCLRYDYQAAPDDSHPNAAGNVAVAQDFTAWLSAVVWD